MRRAGLRYVDICAALNGEGVPTPAGRSRWGTSHVGNLLQTRAAQWAAAEFAAPPA